MNIFSFNLILVVMVLGLLMKFYYHFLMMLMCLEFLVLSILYSIYMNLCNDSLDMYYLLIMVFFVIESVLGLSILVCMICYKGNDHIKNLTLVMW
uniref:NADH dehydrogenase subunit 4L n=1 Tax=Anterhynchium abdominale TaxID=1589846 RepID=A0A6M9AUS4_9HYME|nr:NADH dehydrogenase subunit 4L [Anterhynchium abdominale]